MEGGRWEMEGGDISLEISLLISHYEKSRWMSVEGLTFGRIVLSFFIGPNGA